MAGALMDEMRRVWARMRGWSWPPAYPVAQFPNPPLIVGLAALGMRSLASGAWADVLAAVGYLFIGTWAYLEVTDGVNAFRRALGMAGLAYVVYAVAVRFTG